MLCKISCQIRRVNPSSNLHRLIKSFKKLVPINLTRQWQINLASRFLMSIQSQALKKVVFSDGNFHQALDSIFHYSKNFLGSLTNAIHPLKLENYYKLHYHLNIWCMDRVWFYMLSLSTILSTHLRSMMSKFILCSFMAVKV